MFVIIPTHQQKAFTKRNILGYVASIYDLLGIISPSNFIGKVIYCELRDEKVPWDAEVSVGLKRKIEKSVKNINSVKTELLLLSDFASNNIFECHLCKLKPPLANGLYQHLSDYLNLT